MSDILRRTFAPAADLEIRGDGRTVYGLAVPFDTPTPIRDAEGSYDEVFRMGAFTDTIRERGDRVKFLVNHNRQALPIGRAVSLREDPAGLVGEFRVSNTAIGNEALELIRDGALDSMSIGFAPKLNRGNAATGTIERLAVKLMEVSAVAFPAYEAALIGGVRTITPDQGDEQDAPDQSEAPDQGQANDGHSLIRRARLLSVLDLDLRSMCDESHRIAHR